LARRTWILFLSKREGNDEFFNWNAIRASDIKLIFIDNVGLGRKYRIYEMKAL
jgi:hypothetical protein